jgi:ADP-dependent NAD(P)H-hydrate dehydratase / NAD(P)H-hydrate epimerase
VFLATSSEIKEIDRKTIQETGIPSIVLMENAGRSSCEIILNLFSEKENFLIFAGSGNNGGDGLVVARYLINKQKNVRIYLATTSEKNLTAECQINYHILKKMEASITIINEENIQELQINNQTIIIDALLGNGINGELRGYKKEIINKINSSSATKVSIDIPSGLSADKQSASIALKADYTISLQFPKLSQILYPSSTFYGKSFIVDIGLNEVFAENFQRQLITKKDIYTPKREINTHKYNYGHLAIIAGKEEMLGATILCAKSFLRAGGGLVTCILPKERQSTICNFLPESMSLAISGKSAKEDIKIIQDYLVRKKVTSLIIGPGLGVSESNIEFISKLLELPVTIILDADALNTISLDSQRIFKQLANRKELTVLTPHIGEMSRLLKKNPEEISNNLEENALELATLTNCIIVAKSYISIITDKNKSIFYSNIGTPSLAKAGTGDCLTGIIAFFLTNFPSATKATLSAVYYHGLASKIISEEYSENSLLASDISSYIAKAYKYCQKYQFQKISPFVVDFSY